MTPLRRLPALRGSACRVSYGRAFGATAVAVLVSVVAGGIGMGIGWSLAGEDAESRWTTPLMWAGLLGGIAIGALPAKAILESGGQ